jgi:hypothetical protein
VFATSNVLCGVRHDDASQNLAEDEKEDAEKEDAEKSGSEAEASGDAVATGAEDEATHNEGSCVLEEFRILRNCGLWEFVCSGSGFGNIGIVDLGAGTCYFDFWISNLGLLDWDIGTWGIGFAEIKICVFWELGVVILDLWILDLGCQRLGMLYICSLGCLVWNFWLGLDLQ